MADAPGPSGLVAEASSSSGGARLVSEEDKASSRKNYYKERDASKVYLLDQFPRWRSLKEELALKTDKHVASVLLDFYLSFKERTFSEVYTQTEAGEVEQEPSLSNFSTPRSFGIDLQLFTSTPQQEQASMCRPSASKRRRLLNISPSPVRPTGNVVAQMDETLTASESEGDVSDDDIRSGMPEPIVEMSGEDDLEKTSIESEVYDTGLGGEDQEIDPDVEEESAAQTSKVVPSQEVVQSRKCITFCDKITELLVSLHGHICHRSECSRPLHYQESFVGTCFLVIWKCSADHFGGRWASQPTCEGVRAGNLLLASAIALSGNSFTKTGFLFKIMNLGYFSRNLFYQYQHLYIAPAVQDYWDKMRNDSWLERAGKEVQLSSDGRNDSPGHCAQYCTYSFADMETKAILSINVVDVREVEGRKSANMERIGFERGLNKMLQSEMEIKEIVTDGHTEIGALMKNSETYKDIVHQRDVWHGGKSIAKKVTSVAKEKGKEDLSFWATAVRNHFWFCSKQCVGSVVEFKHMWFGLLHHVVDEHSWIVGEGKVQGQCAHEVLQEDRDKPWLTKNSPAHNALRKIVMNKRFLNTLLYFTNFRHTGFLESFHNHLLMYCPKRHSYSFIGYKMRNQLAAIDFNSHRGRHIAKTADGTQRHKAQYSKRTKQWRPVAVLEPKKYEYISQLLVQIFAKRRDVPGPINQRLTMSADDPRRISSSIAIIPCPPMEDLLESHQSRFAD